MAGRWNTVLGRCVSGYRRLVLFDDPLLVLLVLLLVDLSLDDSRHDSRTSTGCRRLTMRGGITIFGVGSLAGTFLTVIQIEEWK